MNCKLSPGEFLLAVLTAAAFILLVCFTWEVGQSALPPPPVDYIFHRPPMRGYSGLYPPPEPLLDLEAASLIANSAICDKSETPILSLYLVFSHPSHEQLRNAHRSHTSWQTLQALGARRVFLLADGSQKAQEGYPAVPMGTVMRESAKHRDLVVANFTDHYRNLTYKHAMALSWANRFCPEAQHILKMDDDTMVDVWGVANLLRSGLAVNKVGIIHRAGEGEDALDPKGVWAAGLVQRALQPQRRKGKWKVTRAEFPGSLYPDFLSGWAYLITQPAASAIIAAAANNTPFWIDDVYMTGMLAVAAGVPRYALNQHYTLLTGTATCCLDGNTLRAGVPSNLTRMAPLCNLLVAPSEKNISLLASWLDSARACHQGKNCPSKDLKSCPPTRPRYGVGTVIPLS